MFRSFQAIVFNRLEQKLRILLTQTVFFFSVGLRTHHSWFNASADSYKHCACSLVYINSSTRVFLRHLESFNFHFYRIWKINSKYLHTLSNACNSNRASRINGINIFRKRHAPTRCHPSKAKKTDDDKWRWGNYSLSHSMCVWTTHFGFLMTTSSLNHHAKFQID
jgi:hypothetical protein